MAPRHFQEKAWVLNRILPQLLILHERITIPALLKGDSGEGTLNISPQVFWEPTVTITFQDRRERGFRFAQFVVR